jgi:hypothetical protein
MKELEKIQLLLDEAKIEADKVEKGNKAAGVRLRKKMQEIKNLCQEVRKATVNKD